MTAPALKTPDLSPAKLREAAFNEMFVHYTATAALYASSKFRPEEARAGKLMLAHLEAKKSEIKKAVCRE